MAKEWDSWQRFDAVKILTNEQIDKLPEDAEVMGTREQSAGLLFPVFLERSSAMSGGFLFLPVWTVWTHEFPFEAKSRMAVQGKQEENPVASGPTVPQPICLPSIWFAPLPPCSTGSSRLVMLPRHTCSPTASGICFCCGLHGHHLLVFKLMI